MHLLRNAFHVTPATRLVIMLLIAIVTLNSTNTPVAHAAESLPVIQVTVETEPASAQPEPEALPAPRPKPVPWNLQRTIKAPDTTTKPEYSSEPAVRTMVVPATAYTSDPYETDSTPFVTANGTIVRDGIIAANFLKFGTRVRIPEYYGDQVFEVTDRMNSKYYKRIDIWMGKKADARAWGIRQVKIEVLN